jgi:hypothetical protein
MKLPPPKPPPSRTGSTAGPRPEPGPIRPTNSRIRAAGPPPLPTEQRAPMPSEDGYMSTHAKMSLADIALQLRDEQLEARIVHYRADLETNSELDAITAQVIRELTELQKAAQSQRHDGAAVPAGDRSQLEIELIQSLKEMLSRIFREGRLAVVFERKLAEVSKRFARLFFRSELHEKIAGTTGEVKTMRFPEQALYHMFARNEEHLMKELEALTYADPTLYDETVALFGNVVKELRDDFLSRTTPELNELVTLLHAVLREFLTKELPPVVGELGWEVVKEARLAEARTSAGYKISSAHFPHFRHAFERHFLQRLVPYVADQMLARIRNVHGKFRSETLKFVADPRIFSDVCEVICDSVYDSLYNDGFLDLPTDWRAKMNVEG